MDFKENRILIVGGGLLGILLLACLYFLWSARGEYKKLVEQGTGRVSAVQQLQRAIPSPNPDNVKIAEENRAYYEKFLNTYSNLIWKANPQPLVVEPEVFQQRVKGVVQGMQARKKWPGMEVAPSFAFGFPRYAVEGREPRREHLPRLTVQRQILTQLLRILGNSGVKKVIRFGREKFDAPVGDTPGGGGGLGIPFSPQGFGANPAPEAEEELPLWSSESYQLDFLCDEEALRKVANGINRLPYQVKVTQIAFINDSERLTPSEQVGDIGAKDLLNDMGKNAGGGSRPFGGGNGFPMPFQGGVLPGAGGEDGAAGEVIDRALLLAAGNESIRVRVNLDVFNKPVPPKKEEVDPDGGFGF